MSVFIPAVAGAAEAVRLATAHAAVEQVFDRCAAALARYFHVRSGDEGLVDDLMQQLWLSAIRRAPRQAAEVEPWLWTVARNLLRTHWRRSGRRAAHLPLPDPHLAAALSEQLVDAEHPERLMERREARDQVLLALTALPAAEQDLIAAHYFQGESHAVLAGRLGLSVRAIEGRLYRARAALRERLRHVED